MTGPPIHHDGSGNISIWTLHRELENRVYRHEEACAANFRRSVFAFFGLAATLVAAWVTLNREVERVVTVQTEVVAHLEAQDKRMDARDDALERRLNAVNDRLIVLEKWQYAILQQQQQQRQGPP